MNQNTLCRRGCENHQLQYFPGAILIYDVIYFGVYGSYSSITNPTAQHR